MDFLGLLIALFVAAVFVRILLDRIDPDGDIDTEFDDPDFDDRREW